MAESTKTDDPKNPAPPKKTVIKSPKWPLLTFTEALEKARTIYTHEKRNATTVDVMMGHLGLKSTTGRANRTLAALRAYGLVQRQPGGAYVITETAWKILVALPEDSPERQKLMRQAALSPSLFKEILGKYPDDLPSDASLRSYLILNKGFNENTVAQFLAVFKTALAIAKPGGSDYTPAVSEDENDDEDEEDSQVEQEVSSRRGQQGSKSLDQHHFKPQPGAAMEFTLYLSQTKRGVLSIPLEMTAKEWKLLKKQIDSSLDVAEATALVEDRDTDAEGAA